MNWLAVLAAILGAAGVIAADQHFVTQNRSDMLPTALKKDHHTLDNQVEVTKGSQEVYIEINQGIEDLETAEVITKLAEYFIGTPYEAFSLDKGDVEKLRLNLTRFDCMLFVEQLLAIAVTTDWQSFVGTTQAMRYKDGEIDYCSRNHYFQNWAAYAAEKGWLDDVTDQVLGNQQRVVNLTFMSENPSLYPALKNLANLRCISEKEQNLKTTQNYIPNDQLNQASHSLRSGDLFAVATSVQGLDVTHMGVVVRGKDGLSAIHAIPGQGVIRSMPFADYINGVPKSIGAVVLRPRSRRNRVQEQPST